MPFYSKVKVKRTTGEEKSHSELKKMSMEKKNLCSSNSFSFEKRYCLHFISLYLYNCLQGETKERAIFVLLTLLFVFCLFVCLFVSRYIFVRFFFVVALVCICCFFHFRFSRLLPRIIHFTKASLAITCSSAFGEHSSSLLRLDLFGKTVFPFRLAFSVLDLPGIPLPPLPHCSAAVAVNVVRSANVHTNKTIRKECSNKTATHKTNNRKLTFLNSIGDYNFLFKQTIHILLGALRSCLLQSRNDSFKMDK